MNFLTDKKGNISFFRVSILAGVIGVLLIGASALTFWIDQQSRRSPLFIEVPSGALEWGSASEADAMSGSQTRFFTLPGTDVDAVADFYNAKMAEHYGVQPGSVSSERCVRFPRSGTFADVPGSNFNPETDMLFYWRCMFDNNGLNVIQWTEVTIFPGLPQPESDPTGENVGPPPLPAEYNGEYVVIQYDQRWQP